MGLRDARRVLVARKAIDAFRGDRHMTTALRRWWRALAALRHGRDVHG